MRLAISAHRMLPSAFSYSVGIPEQLSFAAQYPARTSPCPRFVATLARDNAGLGAAVGR